MVAHLPSGPLDPVARQVTELFAADPTWQAITSVPLSLTRDAIRAATPMNQLPVMENTEDFSIAVSGGAIALRHYRPCASPAAIILWVHGGGFALGSLDETDNFARQLAKVSDCSVVSVEYRLAPEHKFPTAVNDVQAAAMWVDAHRADLAGRPVPLVLGGDSAGGNLATVVTRKLHAADNVTVAANVLAYPGTDVPESASLRRFVSPFLTLKEAIFFYEQYLPDLVSGHDPDFAPALANNLGLLPRTLIITAEHDLFTEQAENYGRQLVEAGVKVSIIQYPGMIHGFLTSDFFLPGAAGRALRELSAFVNLHCE